MNELTIKLSNTKHLSPTMIIDGKPVKFKKNKFGSLESTVMTEKNTVEFYIYSFLELSSPYWWLWNLLFWFISFFGLFDVPYSKNYTRINCKFTINLKENTKFEGNFLRTNSQKALEYTCDSEVIETTNNYFIDEKVKTRRKLTILLRVFGIIALVVCGIILIVELT